MHCPFCGAVDTRVIDSRLVSEGNRITGVRTDAGDIACDTVVISAGLWSPLFQKDLDFPVPVGSLKGERLLLKCRMKGIQWEN